MNLPVDIEWYLQTYTDVAAAGVDPREHYQRHGRFEGRWPAPPRSLTLEDDLWRGYEDEALPELEHLAGEEEGPERDYANWALARWHASYDRWSEAEYYIQRFHAGTYGKALVPHIGPSLLLITASLAIGNLAAAEEALETAFRERGNIADLELARSNISLMRTGSSSGAIEALNRIYTRNGLQPIRTKQGSEDAIERLAPARPIAASTGEALVSVIVPAFNCEHTISTALASLTAQTWRPLEILVVDDGSTDDTADVVRRWASRDRRIRLLSLGRNQGAYVARNEGLAAAQGEFITVHDADDWSHPEKIAWQTRALLHDPEKIANTSHWVRCSSNLTFSRWRMEDSWIYRNVSSLMFRKGVREEIGYWDRVRVNADTEYYYRILRHYGAESIVEVAPGIPLALGRLGDTSLTRQAQTHLRTQFKGVRRAYHEAAMRWHERESNLFVPKHPVRRPFDIPEEIGVGDPTALLTPDDIVRRSELFDAEWYLSENKDVRRKGMDPAIHYLHFGANEGRDPSPHFSTLAYRDAYLKDGRNPVYHWETEGRSQGLSDPPLFPGMLERENGIPTVLAFAHLAGETLFGAERSFLDMLDRLLDEGLSPVTVLPSHRNEAYFQAVRERSAAVYVMPQKWRRIGHDPAPAIIKRLRQLIADLAPSAVHVNTIVLDAPLLAARAQSVRSVVHVRELPEQDSELCRLLGGSPEAIRKALLEQADHFIANSPDVAEWLDSPDRVELVLNRIDASLFELAFEPGEKVRVAMISSNGRKKGIEDFIAMAKILDAENVPVECILIGPETPELTALRPFPENVTAAGYAAGPREALEQADIVVNLSSFAESFGRTVLEGMAAGRPVVCYDRGMPRRLVENGVSGFVIPVDRPEGAAEAIAKLAADRDLLQRFSEAARINARRWQERA